MENPNDDVKKVLDEQYESRWLDAAGDDLLLQFACFVSMSGRADE